MTEDRRPLVRWWEAIAPGTPTELGFVRIDRAGSSGNWDVLPRAQAKAGTDVRFVAGLQHHS